MVIFNSYVKLPEGKLKKTWKALDKILLKAVDVPFFSPKKNTMYFTMETPDFLRIHFLRRALGPNEPCSGSARSCRESPGAPRSLTSFLEMEDIPSGYVKIAIENGNL